MQCSSAIYCLNKLVGGWFLPLLQAAQFSNMSCARGFWEKPLLWDSSWFKWPCLGMCLMNPFVASCLSWFFSSVVHSLMSSNTPRVSLGKCWISSKFNSCCKCNYEIRVIECSAAEISGWETAEESPVNKALPKVFNYIWWGVFDNLLGSCTVST